MLFVDLYGDQVKKPHTTVVECDFDGYFDQQVRELEGSAEKPLQKAPLITQDDLSRPSSSDTGVEDNVPPIPGLLSGHKKPQSATNSTDITPISTPDSSRPTTPIPGHLLSAKGGRGGGSSRRARKAASATSAGSADDIKKKENPTKTKGKKLRKWDADGVAADDEEVTLDYSTTNRQAEDSANSRPVSSAGMEPIDAAASGTRTGKGQYVLKDLDDEVHSILQGADQKKVQSSASSRGMMGSGLGAISGLFRNVIGGKVLTKEDLEKPLRGMEEHLLKKNVAREAAVRLCEGVERELIGTKTGSFESNLPSLLRCLVLIG